MNAPVTIGPCTLYHADCLEVLPALMGVDVVITDPPYPNRAGHFESGIESARTFLKDFECGRWFVFWDEMESPPVRYPPVARHIWYRSNTNRPDNYEAIYEFNADGIKRASRVFSFPVIFPGLTGCLEATGHPTQKNQNLIRKIIRDCRVTRTIFDPFMGSGTTGVACIRTGRKFIGIEIDKGHFQIACDRIRRELQQTTFQGLDTPGPVEEKELIHA